MHGHNRTGDEEVVQVRIVSIVDASLSFPTYLFESKLRAVELSIKCLIWTSFPRHPSARVSFARDLDRPTTGFHRGMNASGEELRG